MNINRVTLSGRLGQTPELKTLESGRFLTTISLATNEYWKDKENNKQEKTIWHTVKVWGKQAEWVCKNLTKGNAVLVEGKLDKSEWTDKHEQKRESIEVVASKIDNLSPKTSSSEQSFTADEVPF